LYWRIWIAIQKITKENHKEINMANEIEVFLVIKDNFPKIKAINTLVCAIFTLTKEVNGEDEIFSLIYGFDNDGYQADQFFKYYDYSAKIAAGDSSGGWNSAYDYSVDDEAFTDEIDPPEWNDNDTHILEVLHELKWKYLESIEIDDDSYLVPLESSKSSLVKFEKGKGWTAFSSSEFDDEKLTNYSNIWKLEIHWG
jgi:hypothetical protein